MKKTISILAILIFTFSANAQEKQTVKEAVKKDAQTVGKAAKNGANATKNGVQQGVKWTGDTAKKGAKATEKGVKKGANWVGDKSKKGAKAVEKTYQDVKKDIKK
ncbi:hypothetical protein SAMN05421796_104105 [Chryseobacterium piscicola]|jgi:hypothetical protein|uniref:Uncharacterized protein n=1 Tax=Chryseobacterium piscicola TaxID=551459 RepID=A0A1N7MA56_9FLAO|nr:hypothetical protein [Chryseobacterium piscicola]PQA98161.1 hypothetical protein B0A70_00835 [Chryseobacterium piscicola]SIS82932.1 hypothetical protein SAMN05421796_104105 [Chryseobacterium piscicola]